MFGRREVGCGIWIFWSNCRSLERENSLNLIKHPSLGITKLQFGAKFEAKITRDGKSKGQIPHLCLLPRLRLNIRELKIRRRRRQRKQQKSNRFSLAKQQLCTCITLFCTFLCRRCTTTTWKCPISRFVEDGPGGREHKATTFFFFLWALIQSFRINSTKIYQHLTN